jgi:hypothetical protein
MTARPILTRERHTKKHRTLPLCIFQQQQQKHVRKQYAHFIFLERESNHNDDKVSRRSFLQYRKCITREHFNNHQYDTQKAYGSIVVFVYLLAFCTISVASSTGRSGHLACRSSILSGRSRCIAGCGPVWFSIGRHCRRCILFLVAAVQHSPRLLLLLLLMLLLMSVLCLHPQRLFFSPSRAGK